MRDAVLGVPRPGVREELGDRLQGKRGMRRKPARGYGKRDPDGTATKRTEAEAGHEGAGSVQQQVALGMDAGQVKGVAYDLSPLRKKGFFSLEGPSAWAVVAPQ
jgi:hypothetical protein